MADRRPLVLVSGVLAEIPAGDALFTNEVKGTKFSIGAETEQGFNPAFVAKRNVSDFTLGSAHGFSDSTVISGYTGASNAYNSFEARCQFSGTGNLLHWAGFQFNGTVGQTGTTTDLWGYFAAPIINVGTVTNSYGVEIMSLRGTGTVGTAYGVLIRDLGANGLGTTRYGVKQEGVSDKNVFAGQTDVANFLRVTGNTSTPTTGAGLEINYNATAFSGAGAGNILAVDRGASTYKNLTIEGLKLRFRISGTDIASLSSTGLDLAVGNLTLVNPLAVAQGGTGVTALGSGVVTFLGTPTSANFASALTDETGTAGSVVFSASPTVTGTLLTAGIRQAGSVACVIENTFGSLPAGRTGAGLEMGAAQIQSYNRTSNAYNTFNIAGDPVNLQWQGSTKLAVVTGGINVTGAVTATTYLKSGSYTVATLPAAATAGAGARALVTDALGPAFGAAVVGGGAVVTVVYSTGAAWNVG